MGSRWLLFVLFFVPSVASIECCRFGVFCVVLISSSVSIFMLFLCIMHTPYPVLLSGCVII